jgi:type I restriction enzyme S subunit
VIEENELPQGWIGSKLGNVCLVERGITFPATAKSTIAIDKSIVCLRTANVQNIVDWNNLIYIPQVYVRSESKLLRQNDILMSTANSRELVGKVSFVNHLATKSTFGGFIAAIRTFDPFNAKFLFYYLRMDKTQQALRATANQTVNIANLSLDGIYSLPINIPPLAEQHRIVEAIEQQFSRLDTGIASLRSAQKKLKSYRASVLKAAVEGELTAEWRAANPPTEPASVLLERILKERRERWEEEQRAKGRDPKKQHYVEPAEPDVDELPNLPEGWCWATVEQLASSEPRAIQSGPFGSSLLHSEFQETGILAIGIDNVLDGQFSMGRQHRISLQKYEELKKYTARPLDFVITVMATVGRCCVIPEDIETSIITKHVYRITLNKMLTSPYFLSNYSVPEEGLDKAAKLRA